MAPNDNESHDAKSDITPDLPGLDAMERNGDRSDGNSGQSKDGKTGTTESGGTKGIGGALGSAEDAAVKGQSGDNFIFNPREATHRSSFRHVLKAAGKNRKVMLIGGGATTGIVGLAVVVFFMLIPLKIEHIVNNLQSRFFATSEQAVQDQSERMLSQYIKKHVLPALTQCSGTTIDKKCNPAFGNTTNPVDALYKGWSNARLENRLAVNYGIEFRAVKHGSVTKYYMKAPGISNPNGDDITKFQNDDGDLFRQVSRGGARQAVLDSFQTETRWKRVMYRFKVGRLMEEKYGIKRCLAFCGQRDQFAEKSAEKKNAARLLLTQRVVIPRTETLGIVMECLLDPNCHPEQTQSSTPDENGTDGERNGAPENPDVDTKIRATLGERAASYGITDADAVDKMIKDYKTISEKGYQKYALEQVLSKVGLSELTDKVADRASIVGWVNSAADLIVNLKKAGPAVKKLAYAANAPAAVGIYMTYRSYADEVHTGHVDTTEVGSMVSSLGPGNHGDPTDPIVGGTASAESAPLYKELIDGGDTSTSTSLIDSLLPSKAYAVTSDNSDNSEASSDFRCYADKPLTGNTCSEEKLGGGNALANGISGSLSTAPLSYISSVASAWHGVFGGIFSFVGNIFGSVIGAIPGVNSLTSFVGTAVQPFFSFLTDKLIPNPISTNMSGGRKFQMMAAGANVAGNDSCEQIGCQAVDPTVTASIINDQLSQERQDFAGESVFARMFNTDSQYSLISKLAVAVPFDTQASAQNNFASILTSPIGTLTHGLASIFSNQQVFAAANSDTVDAFKIGTVAFPKNKIPADPEKYWDEHNCGDTSENGPIALWQKAAAQAPTNPDTGMPVHTDVEPCLLIKASVGDAGAIYDSSLLTNDEQVVLNGQNGSTSNGSAPGQLPSGNSEDLAKQLLPFIAQGKLFCGPAAGGNGTADCSDIQNTAKSQPLGGNCAVDKLTPHLLGLILALVRDDKWKLGISATCSDHHPEGDGPYAGHSYGSTADFSVQEKDGNRASGAAAAANEKFVNDVAALLSQTGGSFGQVGICHPIYDSQKNSKFTTFNDTCSHQHVRAAP
jgi:hypothetical protein